MPGSGSRAGGRRPPAFAAAACDRAAAVGGEETGPLVPLASPATGEERPDALAVMRAEDGETSWPDDAVTRKRL